MVRRSEEAWGQPRRAGVCEWDGLRRGAGAGLMRGEGRRRRRMAVLVQAWEGEEEAAIGWSRAHEGAGEEPG